MTRLLLPLLAVLLTITSCAKITVERPEGFAEIKQDKQYKAVSPEGMLFGVRTVENYPEQDLDFWSKALKTHLAKEGYRVISDGEPFQAGDLQGILFEWAVPYGNEDFIYLTAIVVQDKKIAIAEAAGVHTVYRSHRDALFKSLKTLAIN